MTPDEEVYQKGSAFAERKRMLMLCLIPRRAAAFVTPDDFTPVSVGFVVKPILGSKNF